MAESGMFLDSSVVIDSAVIVAVQWPWLEQRMGMLECAGIQAATTAGEKRMVIVD